MGRRRLKEDLTPSLPFFPNSHDKDVTCVPGLQPDGDRLGRETPITHAHDAYPSWFQHTRDLRKDFKRFYEVIDTDHTGHHVEALIAEGEGGVNVQILG